MITIENLIQHSPKTHIKMKSTIFNPPCFRLITIIAGLVLICNLSSGQLMIKPDGKIGLGTASPSSDIVIDATELLMKNGSASTTNL